MTPPDPRGHGRAALFIVIGMWAGALVSVMAIVGGRREATILRESLVSEPVEGIGARSRDGGVPLPPLRVRETDAVVGAYRGGRRHTGRTSLVGPRAPRLRFRYDAGGMIKSQVVVAHLDEPPRAPGDAPDAGGPVLPADVLFVTTLGRPAPSPSEPMVPGALIALRADGALLFRRELDEDVYATPLIADGWVFVGSDADVFHSFSLDGDRRFSFPTEGDADTAATLSPSGRVVFSAGPHVHAIARNGTARLRFEARNKVYTSPAIADDGTIYVGSQDDYLYALDSELEVVWSRRIGRDVDSSPVIGDDGAIFVGADDGKVHAFEPGGARRFAVDVGGYVRAPLALTHDGGVVAAVMGPRPRVVALDAATGAVRWAYALPRTESRELGPLSGPLVDGEGAVYFGAHDDLVYALSREGTLLWTFATQGDVDAPPMLLPDGTLVVGSDDGYLYALEEDAPR